MTVFLKGRKLWHYVNGSIPKPLPIPRSKAAIDAGASKTTVAEDDYEACLEEWESNQSKILSWFINTSYLPFIVFFLVLVLLWLLGYFCPIATIALMIQAWSFTLNQSFIKCAKGQVNLFLIIILRRLLCENNFLLQILHYSILRTLSSLLNIGTVVDLCISWWVYMRIFSLLGFLYLTSLLLLLLMLQSRSSSSRRIVGLLITCHPLTICWLYPLFPP